MSNSQPGSSQQLSTSAVLIGSFVLLMVIPVAVFVGAAIAGGMGMTATITALVEQYAADRNNLLIVSLAGLLPLLLILILIAVRARLRRTREGSAEYALAACIPVLLIALFVNLEYWPSYLPERQFLGFPHGLEFVIGPLVFAPIGVLLGFLITWLARRRS